MVDIPRWADSPQPDAIPREIEEKMATVDRARGLLDTHPNEGVHDLMRSLDGMFAERAAQFMAAASQLQMEAEEAARVAKIKRNMAELFSSAAGDLRAAVSAAMTTIEKSEAERGLRSAASDARANRANMAGEDD